MTFAGNKICVLEKNVVFSIVLEHVKESMASTMKTCQTLSRAGGETPSFLVGLRP